MRLLGQRLNGFFKLSLFVLLRGRQTWGWHVAFHDFGQRFHPDFLVRLCRFEVLVLFKVHVVGCALVVVTADTVLFGEWLKRIFESVGLLLLRSTDRNRDESHDGHASAGVQRRSGYIHH